jgi:ferrous iron transport protein B
MHCHDTSSNSISINNGNIALIGQPNVGKSVIFQRLTGRHVVVANYPGTTVEIVRGTARNLPEATLVDTPGVITLPPFTEDEKVTERLLLEEPLRAVIQVGDAKNLRRTLLLTVQLVEMGLPMVLVLNMMDEARARGITINHATLSAHLAIPTIPATAIHGEGVEELISALKTLGPGQFRLNYAPEIEAAVAEVCSRIPKAPIAGRALALLWLSADPLAESWLKGRLDDGSYRALLAQRETLQILFIEPIASNIQKTRIDYVDQINQSVMSDDGDSWRGLSSMLGRLTTHPIWGVFILGLVLYLLYWFVGIFGAGTLVDIMEAKLFGEIINPRVVEIAQRFLPFPFLHDLFVGEYGLWTMGMTYALALIFPIVSTFFLAFGILEDSGYLPRLAALSNRLFSAIGLNGKAVLPMVLGLGCVTMATLTTRVLESKRERLLVTLLLALAIPCSAQLGVIMGMLAGVSLTAAIIWGGVVFLVLLAVGWLASRLVPGERSQLLVELPPLRLPLLSNVLLKTLVRLEWYIKEVVPLFLFGTLLMFVLDKIGILSVLIRAGEPLVTGWLGLPADASAAFLMGFLRRDFGATGLFLMQTRGLLTPLQVVIAMVTITLFIPCIASVMMIAKERGWRSAIGIMVLVFPLAFLAGGLLNKILTYIGWGL